MKSFFVPSCLRGVSRRLRRLALWLMGQHRTAQPAVGRISRRTRPPACPACRGQCFVPFIHGVIEGGKLTSKNAGWLPCPICQAAGVVPATIAGSPEAGIAYVKAATLN